MKEHLLVASTSSSHRRARQATRPTVTPPRVGSGRPARRLGILSGTLGGLVIAAVVPMALAAPAGADAKQTTVNINLTPSGCTPKPAKVSTGQIQFNVANKNAGAVSEAELRTKDLSHILGEQENLTPGLSGGFALVVQPGHYVVNCPGASQQHAAFTVTGKAKVVSAQTKSLLTAAASGYSAYVNQQVASLVSSTQALCTAINGGNQTQAEQLYPQARISYERIEPVAEVWGTLDTAIDGRIDNPVTNPADLEGFHRIEEIMWADSTLNGAAQYCSQLVTNEQQLQTLVSTASYNAVTMASGATDLINEAGTAKITGEEERYSNTDFVVFEANVDGAMEVVNLLQPYLKQADPSLVAQINQQHQAVEKAIAPYKATPGYDDTGYVEYSQVLDPQRRALSAKVQAFAEALSKVSGQVS
jgi:iron uptake system component EfeO